MTSIFYGIPIGGVLGAILGVAIGLRSKPRRL
jgi:hypothetical protein